MNVKRKTKTYPLPVELIKGEKYILLRDEETGRPLCENDTITLKEVELYDILVVESQPHGNIEKPKLENWRSEKYYYKKM